MNTCRRIYLPPLSLIGPNALLELKDEFASRGFTKALFVTDDVLVKIGVAEKVEDVLKGANLDYVTYSSVKQNPNTENVKEGLALLKENGCDCIITLGGGSLQDCGKAVGILATNGGSIENYEGIHVSKKKFLS